MSYPIIISLVQSEDASNQTLRPIRPKPETEPRIATPQSISIPCSVVMPLVPRSKTQAESVQSPKRNDSRETHKNIDKSRAVGDRLICSICKKLYKNKKQLSKHTTVVHKIICANNGIKCLEDPCRKSHHFFATLQCFRDHLDSFHHIKGINDCEELSFGCMEDFYSWLQTEESQSQSHFVLPRGERKTPYGKVLHFVCNRSGSYTPKGTGKRQLKSQGSQKIGFHCTAGIKLTIINKRSKIEVVYHKTHYKHEKSLGHLPLSKADREAIAAMLIQGIDPDSILHGIRSTAGDKVERKHITKRKDLYNIRKSLGIPNPRDVYKIYSANAVSVEEWLQKMDKLGERNPILFYKEEGEEHHLLNKDDIFLIVMTPFQRKMLESFGSDRICVDLIQNVKDYHFELAVIMVIDEFQEPFPVAFCFCSSINFSSMKLFFQSVQSAVDSIQANTFISDDSSAFYNAWAEVFGPANHRLFSWYVDRAWQDKLKEILDEDKKEMVCNMLKTLLYELDKNTFHQTLSQFLTQLKEDSDTLSFCEYFLNYYCNRVPMWAHCYGKEAPIDAEVYIEAFHKILKHTFLTGGENKRIDKCVNTLLSHVLDLQFDHQSKLHKGKTSFEFITSIQDCNNSLLQCFPRERNGEDRHEDQSSNSNEMCQVTEDGNHDSMDSQKLNNTGMLHTTSHLKNDNEHLYVQIFGNVSQNNKSNNEKTLEQLNIVSKLITSKPEISDSLFSIISKHLTAIKHLLRTDSSEMKVPEIDEPVNKKICI